MAAVHYPYVKPIWILSPDKIFYKNTTNSYRAIVWKRPFGPLSPCWSSNIHFYTNLTPTHFIPTNSLIPSLTCIPGAIYSGQLTHLPAEFWDGEETRAARVSPHGYKETVHCPHRLHQRSGSNPGVWQCEAAALLTAPLSWDVLTAWGSKRYKPIITFEWNPRDKGTACET